MTVKLMTDSKWARQRSPPEACDFTVHSGLTAVLDWVQKLLK